MANRSLDELLATLGARYASEIVALPNRQPPTSPAPSEHVYLARHRATGRAEGITATEYESLVEMGADVDEAMTA
jgi:hypothetical protein